MFELQAAIDLWRQQAESSGIPGDSLVELEEHLREDVATFVLFGHTEQEAWRLAVVRLGDTTALSREFRRAEHLSTLDRVALGFIVATVAGLAAVGMAWLAVRGPIDADMLLTFHVVAITFGYVLGLSAAPIAAWCTTRTFLASRPLPRLSDVAVQLIRAICLLAAASTILGFLLGSLWAARHLNRFFTADVREFGALAITAALTAIAFTATRHKYAHATLATALAAAGIICAFWFGPVANEQDYPPLITTVAAGGLVLGLTLAALTLAYFSRRTNPDQSPFVTSE
jgi:ribose/xylose/arabinose/galactoside ABC-type transport system permease subunit